MFKGVNIPRIIKARFPFRFSDQKIPASLSIEFTDACDLKCTYCNNPLFANPRIFMRDPVFYKTIESLKEFKIDRIRVGGGEPTLHPQFAEYSKQLSEHTKFLSIVTNAQWKKKGIAEALLRNYDMIEVSADAGGKELYEASRKGGSYEVLLKNLKLLSQLKKELRSKAHINIRFMVRPSNKENAAKEYELWKQYSDSIMPQIIIQHNENKPENDVYDSVHTLENSFPECTLPFKDLQVKATGNVPLCQKLGSTIILEKRTIIGNVKKDSLKQLWTGKALNEIRNAHRNRLTEKMQVCRGCKGC